MIPHRGFFAGHCLAAGSALRCDLLRNLGGPRVPSKNILFLLGTGPSGCLCMHVCIGGMTMGQPVSGLSLCGWNLLCALPGRSPVASHFQHLVSPRWDTLAGLNTSCRAAEHCGSGTRLAWLEIPAPVS